ncbi:MAG: hypothetical protein ACYTBX_04355 [Planctomycetota bacterium]|jgi:hypothetical protein
MIKRTFMGTLAVLITVAICTAKVCAYDKSNRFDKLADEAEAIVAIRILSTDYSATASDGPMYAKAKVLKVLKGNISTWWKLHFGETGWWGPTYKKGEYRIVFLARGYSKDRNFRAKWRTIYTSGVDFFLAKDSLKGISQESLLDFLTKTKEVSGTPPTINFGIARKDAATRMLSVEIINSDDKAFWLDPSRITISFEANHIRYCRKMGWADNEKDAWRKMEPASSITGSIQIKDEELKEESEIQLMLSHFSACFPHPCWIGAASGNVSIEEDRQSTYHESLPSPSLFEWTNSEDGLLSVCFAVDKTTFSKNEAFSIRCAVRNNTDKSLTILRPFGDEFYSLSSGLHILGPTGSVTYRGPWKDYVLGTDSFHELAPHTVIDETLKIPNNLFPGIHNPGLYKIDYIYQSSGYPRKTKPANYWEGKVIGNSVILLRQPSEAPKAQSGGEEVQLTCSMTKVKFDVGEKLPPPKVTIDNNTSDAVDLIGPTLTVISCRLVQPDTTIVRMCLAMPTGLDPRRMPKKNLEPKSKIDFAPSGIWYLQDGTGYEPYVFTQEGTYKFQCRYEQLTSNTLKLKATKRPSERMDSP